VNEDHDGQRYQARIRDLPASDRPRERLRDAGAGALSNQELLAILLRTGSAKENALALAGRLLGEHQGLTGLARSTFAELCSERGLGEAKAAQLQAALELGRRLVASQPLERPVVRYPEDVANLLQGEMGVLDQEHLRVLLLNTRNQLLASHEVYRGNVHSAVVRISELFKEALRHNAPCMILAHNHPSGDPTPSSDDVAMTKRAIEAGELLDIEVLDHVVLAQGRFASMKSLRMAFL
jgi:DNA repair protein RadC